MSVVFLFWIPACAGMTDGWNIANGFCENWQRPFDQKQGFIKNEGWQGFIDTHLPRTEMQILKCKTHIPSFE